MSAAPKHSKLLRTLPGLLISAFFLWYSFRNISFSQIAGIHFVAPAWIAGVLLFTLASYSLRCVRWARMMRPTGASLGACSRVLMTSLAANNILPLRIGDIMRVFTYAGDLQSSPSVILSTVVLEKLLDIAVLVSLFAAFMGPGVSPGSRHLAETLLIISIGGLLVLLAGARVLQPAFQRLFRRLPPNGVLGKVEHWIDLALDSMRQIGAAGSLLLLVQSVIIWGCEGMIFVSAAKLIALPTDPIGPWQAVSVANLSYLIPSSPGAIGTLEWAVKTSLVSHGAPSGTAALYALGLHIWLLLSITGVGGLIFLLHRFRTRPHVPLAEDVERLPETLDDSAATHV